MKSAYIPLCERILPVENEDDVQVFLAQKLPCPGRMAGRHDALTGLRSNHDLSTIRE